MNTSTNGIDLADIVAKSSWVRIYFLAVISLVSIILNSICIFIFIRINNKLTLNIVYLISLSFFNVIKINSEFIFPLLEATSSNSLNDIVCNIRYWFKYTSGEMCSWILVIIFIDRVRILNNRKPKPKPRHGRVYQSLIVVIILFAVFTLLNSTMFTLNTLKATLKPPLNVTKCVIQIRGFSEPIIMENVLNFSYFSATYSVFYCFLPFLLLIITNLITIKSVKSFKFVKSKINYRKSKEINENVRILLMFSVFFILTSLPTQITSILSDFTNDKTLLSTFSIIYYCITIFESLNNCFNILIFILVNRRLKKDFFINVFNVFKNDFSKV